MGRYRISAVVTGALALSLAAAAPALAGPLAASIDLAGTFTLNPSGVTVANLPGTFLEAASGTYTFTNSFTSTTTPYDLTLGGSVALNGSTILSGTSDVFDASLGNLAPAIAAIPDYGALLVVLGDTMLLGSNSGTISYGGFTVAYDYLGNDTGTFSLGSNSDFGLGSSPISDAFTADAVLTDVPEPGSLLVLGTGLLALGAARRRRWI